MLSSRGCPSSRASFSIVAGPLQNSKELHAPPSDISVSYGLGSGSQTSSYSLRLSLVPVHQFVDQLYFGLLRDRHGRSLDRFLKKGGTTVQIEASPAFGDEQYAFSTAIERRGNRRATR